MKKYFHSPSNSFFSKIVSLVQGVETSARLFPLRCPILKRAYRTEVSSIFKVNGDISLCSGILNYGFLFQQIQIDDGLLEGGSK